MTTDTNTRRRFLGRALLLAGAAGTALLRGPTALARTVNDYLSRIRGRVVLRSDPSYLQWWSAMSWFLFLPRRYPDLIVRAKSHEDILAALAYARHNKLRVTVRSGGHNPAHAVLRKGGMLLDLSLLRAVEAR